VKIGTNLLRKEILDLENANFQLPQLAIISPRRFFEIVQLPFDLFAYLTLASPNDHPKTKSSKNIWRNNNAPTTKYSNNLGVLSNLEGSSLLGDNDTSSRIWVYYYPRFQNLAKLSAIHDQVNNIYRFFSIIFLSIFQRHGDKGLGRMWPMGKLQASLFCLKY
jgi:hypothetical protein